MLFNIPQFIDKEDKIVGPLTAKQLGWFFGAGAVLLVLWNLLDVVTFIVAAIPVVGAAAAFAFYKPNGQPLIYFLIYSVVFLFRPKMYIWKRLPGIAQTIKKKPAKIEPVRPSREITQEKIKEISDLLNKGNLA